MKILKNILFIMIFLFVSMSHSQTIKVTGSWEVFIDETDLQGGPGTDLNPTYTSLVDQIDVDCHAQSGHDYQVDVRKSDSNWDNSMKLWIRRTGDGNGGGWLLGGTVYQQITDSDQQFWQGGKNKTSIPLQFELRDVSVQIAPDVYTTTIWFTIWNTS